MLQRYKIKGQQSSPKSTVHVNKVNINEKQNRALPVIDFHHGAQVLKMAIEIESSFISHQSLK